MMRLVEQLLTVVLTVNVDQIRREQPRSVEADTGFMLTRQELFPSAVS